MAKKGMFRSLISKALGMVQFALSAAETLVGFVIDNVDAEDAKSREQLDLEFAATSKSWQQFYREIFGLEVDFSGLKAPNHKYNDWLVFVSKKLDLLWIVETFKHHFADVHVDVEVGDLKKLESIKETDNKSDYVLVLSHKSLADNSVFDVHDLRLEERLLLDMYVRWGKIESLLADGSKTTCDGTTNQDGRAVEVIAADLDGLTIVLEAPVDDDSVDPLGYSSE